MNASNVCTSSTPAASSSLRPRTRRLISGLDEGGESDYDAASAPSTRIASPLPSPFESRSVSPLPSSHLPRPTIGNGAQRSKGGGALGSGTRQRKAGNESPSSLAGLWGNSWTTLQGIASDLLSGDAAADARDKPARVRRPSSKSRGERSSTSAPPSKWGPAAPISHSSARAIGAGTREEQVTAFRAQKRKDMLTRQESSYADTLGKFKRRLSDDLVSASAPPGEHEDRDALVYVHHVKRDDTLAGITIKYNCSANLLRKANRMWPNDTVQTRQAIVLPVDACGVKGKPVPGPEAIDLLSTDSDALAAGEAEEVAGPEPELSNGHAFSRNRTNSASTNASRRPSTSAAASNHLDTDPQWQHDSWVLLPSAGKPTEIARLSRRALGYFPPARRKSNCYSDSNTPSSSLDLTRELTNDVFATSPLRQDPPQRPQRTRRLSNANNGYFPSYLVGPGGVGTMNRNVHFPGPAQDGLNKMFAKHLPDVAPPRTQQNLLTPEMPLYSDETTPMTSGATTPNFGKNLNLENVGGAIEGWMRRMATNAKSAMEPAERAKAARASVGTPGKGAGGVGDLIEMTDEFEIGDDEVDEDEDEGRGRGRKGSVVHVGPSRSATGYFDGAAVARERSSRGGKSGKDD
ncbi:hypothetical protein LTR36_004627 [Oleoguttula mirabilis]|uniref:LysM domain-containing protein n=1 Tax=Oleoguttula mirabilis TaxID=1507867 RepID=A0AAV9JFW0_9PEZI|nr:hypothetical protein LTR36_004627 [Oleoguttula mirabilis]